MLGHFLKKLLKKLLKKRQTTALSLQGLTPLLLSENALWMQIIADDNLALAFTWLCQQNKESSANNAVWAYRRDWAANKEALQQAIGGDNFAFATVDLVEITNDAGHKQIQESRCPQDRLMSRAIAQVLQPHLTPLLASECTHLKDNGALKTASAQTQAYLQRHPNCLMIKSGMKSYYATIDHRILIEQCHYLLPNEPILHRTLWQFLQRTTEHAGTFGEITQGLPLGSSLSPLLAGIYLSPLDDLSNKSGAKQGGSDNTKVATEDTSSSWIAAALNGVHLLRIRSGGC